LETYSTGGWFSPTNGAFARRRDFVARRCGAGLGMCGADARLVFGWVGEGKNKAATVFRGGNFFVRANDLSFRLNSGMMDHLDGFHFSRDCPWQILGFFRIAGS